MLRSGLLLAASLSVIIAEHCEVIDGIRQSPIDIDPFAAEPSIARSLKWSSGYAEIPDDMFLINDGHTLKLSVNQSVPIELSGGLLDVPYEFKQLHFHWGDDSNEKGSEHKIKGKSYPLEMHAVHSQSSTNDTDDTVVVAFFFRPSLRINRGLQNLLDAAIVAAENRNISISVDPFILSELVLTSSFTYYTYKGSLTTPPYSESVTWIVASTALPISKNKKKLRQSPVNIVKSTAIQDGAAPFKWSGFEQMPKAIYLTNDGRSLTLTVTAIEPIQLSGGRLKLPYEFKYLNFHWASEDGKGSEHTVDGKSYPLEMQLVHTKVGAKANADTFVIVSFMFKVVRSTKGVPGFRNLIEIMSMCAKKQNTPVNCKPFPLSNMLPTGSFPYYTYKGSLTVEPYTESVTWIIGSTPLPMSSLQLKMLRKAAEVDKALLNNFREPQELSGRKVLFIKYPGQLLP